MSAVRGIENSSPSFRWTGTETSRPMEDCRAGLSDLSCDCAYECCPSTIEPMTSSNPARATATDLSFPVIILGAIIVNPLASRDTFQTIGNRLDNRATAEPFY